MEREKINANSRFFKQQMDWSLEELNQNKMILHFATHRKEDF